MDPTITDIITPWQDKPELLERIAHRKIQPPVLILEPNPQWPIRFEQVKQLVRSVLGDLVLDIAHTGSTSVPGLPAKDIIDVDLTLRDVVDEDKYVEPLESAGFLFLLREPYWHHHRFFAENWPGSLGYHVNLHVWGPRSPEVARHRIFRDWLRKTPADRDLYASIKREAAVQLNGDTNVDKISKMKVYTHRKDEVCQEILNRAFRDLGYIQ